MTTDDDVKAAVERVDAFLSHERGTRGEALDAIDLIERTLSEQEAEIERAVAAEKQWRHKADRDREDYHRDLDQLTKERDRLAELVRRAAAIFDDHIDSPQAVSHAELRATGREFRAALAQPPAGSEPQ